MILTLTLLKHLLKLHPKTKSKTLLFLQRAHKNQTNKKALDKLNLLKKRPRMNLAFRLIFLLKIKKLINIISRIKTNKFKIKIKPAFLDIFNLSKTEASILNQKHQKHQNNKILKKYFINN